VSLGVPAPIPQALFDYDAAGCTAAALSLATNLKDADLSNPKVMQLFALATTHPAWLFLASAWAVQTNPLLRATHMDGTCSLPKKFLSRWNSGILM